jgi:integrase/recombinase XerC
MTTTTRPAPIGIKLPVPALWESAIYDFLSDREAAGKPATSRRSYKSALEHLARGVTGGPFEQTRSTLREFIVAHPEWSNETRRSRRGTMVLFYDWAMEEGLMSVNPARQLPKVRASKPHPKPAPSDAYQRALQLAAPRERLMLRLSHEMGLRRAEVARIHSRDLWEDYGGGYVLAVHGKGSKVREMPVPDSLARELTQLPEGFVFPGKRDGHLSAEYVGKRVAELLPGEIHMHHLRHSYATRLYQATGDIVLVQGALGHANPNTTMSYVLTDNMSKLRAQMEAMSAPQRIAG